MIRALFASTMLMVLLLPSRASERSENSRALQSRVAFDEARRNRFENRASGPMDAPADPIEGPCPPGSLVETDPNCGLPTGVSNCCVSHPGPGCDDPACQATICTVDPFCCNNTWDDICAAEAFDLCGALCGPADPNGGCNNEVPAFISANCGATVCGSSASNGAVRDTDWYEVTLSSDSDVTWSVTAEFDALVGVIASPCPQDSFLAVTATAAGVPATVSVCVAAGTYYLFVAQVDFDPLPCPTPYVGTVSCEPCTPPPSNCCVAHPDLGCDDVDCEALVCAMDASCCDIVWDEMCAAEAVSLCGPLCTSAATVSIVSSNPPDGHIDPLQTGLGSMLTQGIGGAGTPNEGAIQYSSIAVTFSGTPSPAPSAADVVVTCTGGVCPSATSVSGVDAGPYEVSLSGPIPPLHCTTMSFSGPAFAASQQIQYLSSPGNVNLSPSANTQDLLDLIQALNNGAAAANSARYNLNRVGASNTQDLLRLIQLLNGVLTTQAFNGQPLAACP